MMEYGHLVLIAFLALSAIIDRLGSDLLVVLLEGSKILTGLGELTFFHAFTDVPVHESTLGVHQVKLVVQAGEHFSDGGRIGDHAHSTLDLGQVSAGNNRGRLVVDTALEASGAPVDELDGAFGLDGSDGSVDILAHNITTVHHAAGHVLAVTGVALHHGTGGLESTVGDLGHGQLLVVGLLGRDDRGIGRQQEVDTGVGN